MSRPGRAMGAGPLWVWCAHRHGLPGSPGPTGSFAACTRPMAEQTLVQGRLCLKGPLEVLVGPAWPRLPAVPRNHPSGVTGARAAAHGAVAVPGLAAGAVGLPPPALSRHPCTGSLRARCCAPYPGLSCVLPAWSLQPQAAQGGSGILSAVTPVPSFLSCPGNTGRWPCGAREDCGVQAARSLGLVEALHPAVGPGP